VLELLAADLSALEPGRRGDLLCEWVGFDADGDGLREGHWPRLRLVRLATPGELAHLAPEDREPTEPPPQGLVEVIWAVLPETGGFHRSTSGSARDARALGFLWRGERIYGPEREGEVSFFSERYLSDAGAPPLGSLEEVAGGVLWLGIAFAAPTTLVGEGWTIGGELGDAAASWDAWARGRPDADAHSWNEPLLHAPEPRGRPVLPRRVRLELELEERGDLLWRTRLSEALSAEGAALRVEDGERLPPVGGHVRIDDEWIEVRGVTGATVTVARGARGTAPRAHEAGVLVHYGRTTVREVPIGVFREDWDL
jgi:hypothetical protein